MPEIRMRFDAALRPRFHYMNYLFTRCDECLRLPLRTDHCASFTAYRILGFFFAIPFLSVTYFWRREVAS